MAASVATTRALRSIARSEANAACASSVAGLLVTTGAALPTTGGAMTPAAGVVGASSSTMRRKVFGSVKNGVEALQRTALRARLYKSQLAERR
eukprot:scaffold80141_cov63-Phaeocystis_antarctica.AAC.3